MNKNDVIMTLLKGRTLIVLSLLVIFSNLGSGHRILARPK